MRANTTLRVTLMAGLSCLAAGCSKNEKSGAAAEPAGAPRASEQTHGAGAAPAASSAAPPASAAPSQAAGSVVRKLIGSEDCASERAFVDCILKGCGDAYRACYGERADQGELAGPCAEHGKCMLLCSLDPDVVSRAACELDCDDRHKAAGEPCDQCMSKVADCTRKSGCTAPEKCP